MNFGVKLFLCGAAIVVLCIFIYAFAVEEDEDNWYDDDEDFPFR